MVVRWHGAGVEQKGEGDSEGQIVSYKISQGMYCIAEGIQSVMS